MCFFLLRVCVTIRVVGGGVAVAIVGGGCFAVAVVVRLQRLVAVMRVLLYVPCCC